MSTPGTPERGSPLGSAAALAETVARLAATIDARALTGDASASWTAKLLAQGAAACAKKLGEEALETVLAVSSESEARVAAESADMLFHLLVALRARGVSLDDVAAVLAAREGRSGLEEKAARS